MATFLIAGCGDIGSGLALALCADGHRCYGLKRDISQLPAPIQGIAADLSQPEQLKGLPAGIDYLVYAVAAGAFDAATYQAAYVDGLRHLLTALNVQDAALKRVLFISSSAVYHQQQGEWVNEASDTTPQSFSGKAMLAAERVLHAGGYPSTAVRFSGIYGPGRERIINWVKAGVGASESPCHYGNRIHREDCIGVLKFLIDRDLAGEPVADLYLASDPNPAPYHEVLEWLRQQLELPEPTQREDFSLRLRTGSKRCQPARLLVEGYRFKYPSYREGFAAMLEAEGSNN
ncbi:SDR family oxidoreductase [Motiliproteus sediminis]|uniref:SDR family oxidoreductase n=1 Tax=Motiliproteus sediminis TaxID=1468178 RepID=UPI001AEF5B68|nr:SDR family oxidoreductase [Motiliproteus sediminis]